MIYDKFKWSGIGKTHYENILNVQAIRFRNCPPDNFNCGNVTNIFLCLMANWFVTCYVGDWFCYIFVIFGIRILYYFKFLI